MGRVKRLWILVGLLAAGGCANPIRAWQTSLEEYVVNQGNGDLNVLRSRDRRPSESDFGLIGASTGGVPFVAPVRTDANGVLLGLRSFHDRSWYVYLLGTVKYHGAFVDFPLQDPRLRDIRLVAVSGDGGSFRWLVSLPDGAAVDRYCRPQLETWRRSHSSRAQATTAPTRFPTPADDFRLEVAPEALTVVDEHSHAQWTLSLESE